MGGAILYWLCFISFTCILNGGRTVTADGVATFDVTKYGAKGNGQNDDTNAFTAAWKAACQSPGSVKLFIPKTSFLVGPIKFIGPCKNTGSITVQLEGNLKATTDLSKYGASDDWIEFGWLKGLILTGGGTFDGQGAVSWASDKCPKNLNCKVLPTSVKFVQLTNTIVNGIHSLNSKFFHFALLDCKGFIGSKITITAPEDSPNTDGIHIERSNDVNIFDSIIGTGDDCISIGQANSNVHIKGVTCGPGHGISVGSLGRYPKEGDVTGLIVNNCTISGTMNGVRIKTWKNSPDTSVASNMTFDDIIMINVNNPIIVDQSYCPYAKCDSSAPSRVELRDLHFRNIRGTSSSPVAVTLKCSQGVPCKNVNLENVHLELANKAAGTAATSSCEHAIVKYTGTQIPPPCKSSTI